MDTTNTTSPTPALQQLINKCLGGDFMFRTAKISFSAILVNQPGKGLHMISKNQNTPSFELDWTMYMVFRTYAKSLMTTGGILRSEAKVSPFGKPCFPHPDLEPLYKTLNPERKKVFILSKNIDEQDVKKFIDQKYYEPMVIGRPDLKTSLKTIQPQQTINGYMKQLPKPLLVECGTKTLNEYLSTEQNMIDGIMLTIFEGKLPESVIGLPFDVPMEKYFKLDFVSESFKHELGTFKFYVYKRI